MNAPELLGARALRELLSSGDVRPRKRYGQNFVVDPNTIRKVLDVAALDGSSRVLEIGAGVGSLTLGLASIAGQVTAVEIDDRLIPLLQRTMEERNNVDIVHADVMDMDLARLRANVVVANLPYNLAATIVLKLLMDAPSVERLTVMVQREVGERLVASAGSKIYGQTSVLLAFYASARIAAQVSKRAFYPVPDVDSVLVRIERRSTPDVDASAFHDVVRAAFSQRRKTLRNSLASLTPEAATAFDDSGVSLDLRAEDVELDGYVALARALAS